MNNRFVLFFLLFICLLSTCNKSTSINTDYSNTKSPETIVNSKISTISTEEQVNTLIFDYIAIGSDKYSDRKWIKEFYKSNFIDFGNEPTAFKNLRYFNDLFEKEKEFYGKNDINYYLEQPKIGSLIIVNDSFEDYHFLKAIYTFYIVKLEYKVLANELYQENKDSLISIFDRPIEKYSYIVMMKDKSDGKIKIVDSYPNLGYPSHTIQYRNIVNVYNTDYFTKNAEMQTIVAEIVRKNSK